MATREKARVLLNAVQLMHTDHMPPLRPGVPLSDTVSKVLPDVEANDACVTVMSGFAEVAVPLVHVDDRSKRTLETVVDGSSAVPVIVTTSVELLARTAVVKEVAAPTATKDDGPTPTRVYVGVAPEKVQ